MRHSNAFRKFQKSPAHRRAMLRNMATSVIREEHIRTTVEKAKEVRRVVDKMVTLGKRNTLASRRAAASYLMDTEIVKKLFSEVAPRFKTRAGGYTRIVRADHRHGDSAQMAYLQFVDVNLAPVVAEKADVAQSA